MKESTNQWLSSGHCVYVGTKQDIAEWSTATDFEDNFLVADRNSDGCWLFGLRYLDWDTKHFQMKMGKIFPFITPNADPHSPATLQWAQNLLAKLLSKAKDENYNYLSVLAHPEDTVGQLVLSRAGFELMDTTFLYELNLNERIAQQTNSAVKVRIATETDIAALQEISEICFGERKNNINRFNSDPHLDQDKVKDLYKQWIYNSLGGRNMADLVLIAHWENQLAGFLTLKLDQETKLADIPLNAVNPRYSGHGIYKAMVNYALDYLIANEFKGVEIWTHVTNFAVQKTWQKLGASAKFCAHQYRLILEI